MRELVDWASECLIGGTLGTIRPARRRATWSRWDHGDELTIDRAGTSHARALSPMARAQGDRAHDDGIEIKATWRDEWVVNPERRYTHGGVARAR